VSISVWSNFLFSQGISQWSQFFSQFSQMIPTNLIGQLPCYERVVLPRLLGFRIPDQAGILIDTRIGRFPHLDHLDLFPGNSAVLLSRISKNS